jgi:hypothetical protein
MLEVVASGFSLSEAARQAGIPRQSLYDWKAADPQFAAELEAAYQEGTERFADALMQRALLPDHDALAIFLLKQRDPARFSQKQIEVRVAGDPNAPIGIEHHQANPAWIFPRKELERPPPAKAIILDAVVEPEPEELDPDEALEAEIDAQTNPEDEAA